MHCKKFGIEGKIEFEYSEENYPSFVMLYSKESECKLALHGAHILSFIPTGSKDLLWLSSKARYEEGTAIRGGIPLCFPWFASEAQPAHGFARTHTWEVLRTGVDEEGNPHIRLGLASTAQTRKLWDYDFHVQVLVRVSKQLSLEFIVENRDSKSFMMTEALHSYFAVSNIENVLLLGLEGKTYTDSLNASKQKIQEGAIKVDAEIDRIYHDSQETCTIVDSGEKRKIVISKENSDSTVVWNPWIEKSSKMGDFDEDGYQNMLCVESANVAPSRVTVNPSQCHSMKLVIEEKR